MADARGRARRSIATAVWLLAIVAAAVLAVGALVVALEADRTNAFVDLAVSTAGNIDVLGVLPGVTDSAPAGKGDGGGQSRSVRSVLVSWGACAVGYLVVGKLLDRLIRP